MSPKVLLPGDLIERCFKFGQAFVDNPVPASLAFASHGAEDNPELQAHAKMAECAVCLWAGLDPLKRLHWAAGRCDAGYDVTLFGLRLDVKQASQRAKNMIWPTRKTGIFATKQFDVLVQVKDFSPAFELVGWMDKESFGLRHRVAGEGHYLALGTWYMPEGELYDMYDLEAFGPL